MVNDCIFCKIINKEIPSKIIAENDFAIAFLDINPSIDGHTIIIPKKHFRNFCECDEEYSTGVNELAKQVCKILEDKLNAQGFNFVSNMNSIAGQVIFHYHLHILPRYVKNEVDIFKQADWLKISNVDEIYKKIIG